VDFIFEQQLLRFTDPRRFGCILWTQADLAHPLLAHLGVEPLTQAFNAKTLHQLAKRRQVPIKTLIMDPKVVVGVGNIYATESCYQAQINPWLPAHQATLANYQVLVPAIKKILRQAIKVGGTTLKDFQNVQGKPGHFKTQLQVYGRQGQPCHRCQTIIQAQVMQQRNTSFCPLCQA
jgi:formamidopyrimidine-DNA glycosylase